MDEDEVNKGLNKSSGNVKKGDGRFEILRKYLSRIK